MPMLPGSPPHTLSYQGASTLQAEEEQRERVRRALQEVDAELAGDGEEDPYWVPFDDCPGAGEHCAACWGCPKEVMHVR